jgi:hypothetical protein
MNKSLILALCLISVVTAEASFETELQFEWSTQKITGNLLTNFGWSAAHKQNSKTVMSPVFWKAYTIVPMSQPGKYQGGFNCKDSNTCVDTKKTSNVEWSHNEKTYILPKPSTLQTKFSLDDNVDPTANPPFEGYLGAQITDVANWPIQWGFSNVIKDRHLMGIWGLNPESAYFDYIRSQYPTSKTQKNTDITFKMDINYDQADFYKAIERYTPGKIYEGSKFSLNIGGGKITNNKDDKLDYYNIDQSVKGFWTIPNARVVMNDERIGSFDDYGFGNTCMSNFWHNSIVAMRDPKQFKIKFANLACQGKYAWCSDNSKFDITKAPTLKFELLDLPQGETFSRSKTYQSREYVIKPEDYIYRTKNHDGELVFESLLIGSMYYAVKENACPESSKFGIGHLFYKNHQVNFVQKRDSKNRLHQQIGFVGLTSFAIKGSKLKNLVVILGLLSVFLFFVAILVCKSMSKPLEVVSDEQLHGTIGITEKQEGDEYAKPTDDDSA